MNRLIRWVLLSAIGMSPYGVYAMEPSTQQSLDRPIASHAKKGEALFWMQYDQFSPKLDFMNFSSKTGTTSTIDSSTTTTAGLSFAVTDKLRLRYSYSFSTQDGTRQVAPRNIHTTYTGHDIRLQQTLYDHFPLLITVESGYRSHTSNKASFNRYQVGSGLLGGSGILGADFSNIAQTPLFYDNITGEIRNLDGASLATIQTRDASWLGAIRSLYQPWESLHVGLSIEFRKVRVHANMSIPALNDPAIVKLAKFLGPLQARLKQELPQSTPWDETHVLIQASLNWQPWETITFGADLTHYQIKRNGYIPSPKRPIQYNSSDQLDGYIFWQVMKHITLYGHGRASTRYLLGDLPLAYNSRSNHRFNNPYGFLSAGGVVSF